MPHYKRAIKCTLAAILAGCTLTEAECPDAVTVRFENVGNGRFTWEADCIVNDLNVERAHDTHMVWSAHGRLRPPITYGVAERGMSASDPEPLVLGERYRVVLWKEARSSTRMVASVEFIFGSPSR
jgi:hypothetical protein